MSAMAAHGERWRECKYTVITYTVEKWDDCHDELERLLPEHFAEVEQDRDHVPLCLDHGLYQMLADADRLHISVCRDDGDFVGYLAAIVGPNLHQASSPHAVVDAVYLKPEYRRGLTGVKLYQHFEQEMVRRAVKKMYAGHKVTKDLSAIFKRLGYQKAEVYYSKVIN